MNSSVPQGWEKRLAEGIYKRKKIQVTHDRNTVLPKGIYPVIDQSNSGEIGFLDKIPEFQCSNSAPLVTFANHTCAVRKMTTPFGVIQNVFPLGALIDTDIDFIYQSLLAGIEPEGYMGHYPKLRETEFLVPPLPEQKKIASILTSVDDVIENTQKQIDKLQDLKMATMNELLTKGIGRTEFKGSELGQIPKSWEVVSLGDLLIDRPSNGVSPPETEDENHLLSLSLGCLTKDGFSLVQTKMVEKRKNFESSLLVDKDFLISRSNTRQLVGLVGIIRGLPAGFIYPDLMMRLTTSDKVKKEFLEYLMLSPSHRQLISNLAQGTSDTMVKLNSQSVRQIPIQLPSLTEQKEIVHILTSIKNRILTQTQKLSQTQSLKKSLMQDLLTGKVRVMVN